MFSCSNKSINNYLYNDEINQRDFEEKKFWGKGFTEWWNVRKTYQIHDKHLPLHPHPDIGEYNILDYKTRKRWNDYAEEYGFYGYIFYHYWFSKGIVMNKPLDKILEDGQFGKLERIEKYEKKEKRMEHLFEEDWKILEN